LISITSAVCVLDSLNSVSCQFIRSYSTRGINTPDCTILQAACATIASPEAYEPVIIGDEDDQYTYMNAMTGYANPTNEVLKEAEKVFGKNAVVANLVSVGSGKLEIRQQQDTVIMTQLSDLLKRAVTDTERVHNDIYNRFQDLGIYFRFNAEGILPVTNSTQNTTRIQTAAYLEDAPNSHRLDRAVASIRERKEVKSLKDLSTISSFYVRSSISFILQIRSLWWKSVTSNDLRWCLSSSDDKTYWSIFMKIIHGTLSQKSNILSSVYSLALVGRERHK
jgi:hypothetical protein